MELILDIRTLAAMPVIRRPVEPVLRAKARPVRALLFDKTPNANWKVPRHQDLSIAVKKKADVEGFGPWSRKAGVVHVQPTTRILEPMLAVRIHLDDCDESNGPLRVIPGSHRQGRLSTAQLSELGRNPAVVCTVPAGGVLLMRPLWCTRHPRANLLGAGESFTSNSLAAICPVDLNGTPIFSLEQYA